MPSTQAYTVDWDVSIQPEGNVDRDVVSAVIQQRNGKPDSCTVQLDTSERPHALEEEKDIKVELSDSNTTVTFNGRVDAVKDDKEQPLVTVDAREPDGVLDDVSAVGSIREDNLFDCIDAVIDSSAGKIRGITFDPSSLISNFGTFAESTVFGTVEFLRIPSALGGAGSNNVDDWTKMGTTGGDGVTPMLDFSGSSAYYTNTTTQTGTVTLLGKDGNGDDVAVSFDLPPGNDAVEAYGTVTPKPSVEGGTGKVAEINSIDSDNTTIPSAGTYDTVNVSAPIENFVKTSYDFTVGADQSVRDVLDLLVGYISTLDGAQDWEFYVEQSTSNLIVQPVSSSSPDTYVFTEGDNVLRPVANRSLDDVYNMVKVSGSTEGSNVWAWAYGGTFYISGTNPFQSGDYPTSADTFGSTAGVNDIDKVDLRATSLSSPNAADSEQVKSLVKEALRQLLRTPVSGVAKVTGIHPANPGDKAEVYYPSRGIPAKVADNVYTVEQVEYEVSTDEATTKVDFGVKELSTGDVINGYGGGLLRSDLSPGVGAALQDEDDTTSDAFPQPGVIINVNSDGTADIEGADGNVYNNVDVVS